MTSVELTQRQIDFIASTLAYVNKLPIWSIDQADEAKKILDVLVQTK